MTHLTTELSYSGPECSPQISGGVDEEEVLEDVEEGEGVRGAADLASRGIEGERIEREKEWK